ncbi:MAG: hypothetical protein HYZ14_05390 [Bacteroidetes bacterium]|nr:hypothetical protein [Bacteroidota bacterium]
MIAINQETVASIQREFFTDLENQRKTALRKLIDLENSGFKMNKKERDYLSAIIRLFEKPSLLLIEPKEIETLKARIGPIPPSSGKTKKLKEEILERLGYKSLRRIFYPRYFERVGIKTCVYCNSILTVSTVQNGNLFSSRFDVDHYHAKDLFPFLSIFPFNLYPSCAPCNRKKSKSTSLMFDLYSTDVNKISKSVFTFKLDKGSIGKYLLTKDSNDLKFEFGPVGNDFQHSFGIEAIYNTQKDVIEELIAKSQMYDAYNRQALKNSFSKLDLHPNLYLRTLVGTYIKESEIHKRPMSKFTQDIAKQLGLI